MLTSVFDIADVLSDYLVAGNILSFANTCKDISNMLVDNAIAKDRILQTHYANLVLIEMRIKGRYNQIKNRIIKTESEISISISKKKKYKFTKRKKLMVYGDYQDYLNDREQLDIMSIQCENIFQRIEMISNARKSGKLHNK